MKLKKIDRPFIITVILLVIAGFFIFSSASLGLLVRSEAKYSNATLRQGFYGLFLGVIFLIVFSRIDYKLWRRTAFYILLFAIFLTLAVFIPGIGFTHGGATRWISVGPIFFQPSELLKIAFII
jgi:cell division protein FtsW